ncbi:hypothetical protein ACFQ1T_13335 [Methylophilus glucosoxydans]|uniref:Class I SAM-dependent methyltransferase n=1 Tax=Methylophilus glucosoxydans TaxID=752553 RepID=A0ABW3GM18_9PROT
MKTIFELVKLVLDDLYKETKNEHSGDESATDKEIKEQIEYLADNYKKLTDKNSPGINYKKPATRFAYVYKYVASHADYIFQLLENLELKNPDKFEPIKSIFLKDILKISCIGGGPGSDIVGLLKYLLSLDKQKVSRVTCYLCDKEQAWADSWTEIDNKTSLKEIILNTNFQPLDVTDSTSWQYQKKFLDSDIFTLSYFVSEVSRLDKEDLENFWDTIFTKSKTGSAFIFIDNAHTDFTTYFDNKWSEKGMKVISSADATVTPSSNEQLSVFGEYLTKFPNKPKLRSQISFRLLIKEQ